MPSAPDPNPLQHGPAFPPQTGVTRPGRAAASNHTGASAPEEAGGRDDAGEADNGIQGVRSNSAEGDDELSMIEAEVAMLANFGSGHSAQAATTADAANMPGVNMGSAGS